MRVLFCGDRAWSDGFRIWNIVGALKAEHGTFEVIHGAARGADTFAASAAAAIGLPTRGFDADWKQFGKRAGPIRNRRMLDEKPDLVVAFHNNIDVSRGTRDCIKEALRRGIPVRLVTTADVVTVDRLA